MNFIMSFILSVTPLIILFTLLTENETNLGLSTISSVYTSQNC